VAEWVVRWVANKGVEIVVIGKTVPWTLAGELAAEHRVDLPVARQRRHRHRRLRLKARQRRGEPLRTKQRTARRAGRHSGKGTAREWAQAVLAHQHAGRREDAPPDQLAPGHLPQRSCLDDLRTVLARPLRFPLPY